MVERFAHAFISGVLVKLVKIRSIRETKWPRAYQCLVELLSAPVAFYVIS